MCVLESNLCAVWALCAFSYFSWARVTEWSPIWGIAAHSAYDVFSWYKYLLNVILVFYRPSVYGVGFVSDCAISRSLPACTFE